jgi:hypothetical protein
VPAALTGRAEPASVAEVLEAFVRPDIETMRSVDARRPTMARFLGRTCAEPTSWIREMALEQFDTTAAEFRRLFGTALPHLDGDEVGWRLLSAVAVIVGLFTHTRRRSPITRDW